MTTYHCSCIREPYRSLSKHKRFIPCDKFGNPFLQCYLWLIPKILRQFRCIRIGYINISLLHRQHLQLCLCTQCGFKSAYKIHQWHRMACPYIINTNNYLLWIYRLIYYPHNALDNIVDISKVSRQFTIIKHLYRLSLYNRFTKQHGSHIRSPPWPIYGKKAQPCCGKAKQMRIDISHQLIRFFCSGIKRYRIIDIIGLCKRSFCITSIYRTR